MFARRRRQDAEIAAAFSSLIPFLLAINPAISYNVTCG